MSRHQEALDAYRQKDFKTALAIWEEEAKENNDQAFANLGLIYLQGEGVERDQLKAKELFEKASELGNESGDYNLALMYQAAIGVEENFDKAIAYFRNAVKKNHQGANFRLALLLLRDRIDEELVREGFNCMLNAALTGHTMAKIQVGGLDRPANKNAQPNEAFRAKTKEEQQAVVEDAINRYIRPMLIKDGGNIMMIDYLNDPDIDIRLAYQGNCAGCSLSSTSTYELIRNTLNQVIDENIKVYVI